MDAEEDFVTITSLICEASRAKMLWNLLDGRAYTAGELAIAADISATSASNHLAKLLEATIVKVEIQGRHRYYSFSRPEVAYVVESLAMLATHRPQEKAEKVISHKPVKFCRTCYDHLAGFVGVKCTEALEFQGYIEKSGIAYTVSDRGWDWFQKLDISKNDFKNPRRPLTRQCLDWSERRPHLAGQLGALLLEKMLQKDWFRKAQFSRHLTLTSLGSRQLSELLGLEIS
ncbi:ArsR/SmtB family transcription factor [Dyadobacter arcticus]|uniref:DNA-binding transcriptional ArsR family regulator n=1 Tax=Dyadobacter arcticus TaxID=1078754 RepID=A0ABX0UQR1_9BACT|nr:helix-turn-helix transcriptional regulator [Dyadobacter arcticus]NIJ54748.1 DNA-binding transcriptional ArsR family regulator [Dyadobacter arcticus]